MNGFIKFLYIVFSILCLWQISFAGNKSLCYEVKINKLLKETKEDLNVGIIVANPINSKIIYQKNANHYFIPASTLKLLTAYTALKKLTPNFHYQTFLLSDLSKLNEGVLNHPLTIKFNGDPTLSLDDLDNLFHDLKDKGVNKINGKIIIATSSDDNNPWPPGVAHDDLKFCYAAPVGPIIINENCFAAELIPHDKQIDLEYPKQPLLVNIDKKNLNLSNDKDDVQLVTHENNFYQLSGEIKSPLSLNFAVQNQHLYILETVRYLLQKNNIAHSQKIVFGKVPISSGVISHHDSKDLTQIINVMLKESNNCMANAIFKKLGSLEDGRLSWEQGTTVVKSSLGIDKKQELKIFDGAGASRYNLITPKQLMKILNKSYSDKKIGEYLLAALPIAGVDGTLKDRMQNLKGKVMAKTGTSSGISSLAGYIKTKHNHLLSFVIMINNGISPNKEYKDLEDKICNLIFEFG